MMPHLSSRDCDVGVEWPTTVCCLSRSPIWPLDHIPDTDTDMDTDLVAEVPAEGAGR